jgi:hypothetical protein
VIFIKSAYFIFTYFILFTLSQGCVSAPEGFVKEEASEKLKKQSEPWQARCLQKGRGSATGYLVVPKVPHLEWEGIWNRQYSYFKAGVLSPVGETLVDMELIPGGNPRISTSVPESQMPAGLASVLSEVGKLGGLGFRKVVCGTFFFDGNPTDIFVRKTKLNKDFFEDYYILNSKFKIHDGLADIHSKVHFYKSFVRVESEIFAGFLLKKNYGRIIWRGEKKGAMMEPVSVEFLGNGEQLKLIFSEFD